MYFQQISNFLYVRSKNIQFKDFKLFLQYDHIKILVTTRTASPVGGCGNLNCKNHIVI